jgi:3-methyladenine DNA glycosylase AlkC
MNHMFQLIQPVHHQQVVNLASSARQNPISSIAESLRQLIEEIREQIPPKKKISYGRYSIVKRMGFIIHPEIKKSGLDVVEFGTALLEDPAHDHMVRSLAVQLISIEGCETGTLHIVLPIFEKAAADDHWEVRECAAGFIRKLIEAYPDKMLEWVLKQVESPNPLLRRFASESIRPVADNRWFKKRPDFCFQVIEHLYEESDPYPRTSVGNNLSDWSKIDKERVYRIVDKLVRSGNKHSYWIAYRACRNLVKKEPIRVMDALGVDEYKYKKRVHRRKDVI